MITNEKNKTITNNDETKNIDIDLEKSKRWNRVIVFIIALFVILSFIVIYIFRIRNMRIYNPYETKVIKVSSEEKDWHLNDNINLFYKVNDKGEKLIYPGDSGKYDFIIDNTNSIPVNYKLRISEENPNSINIKYRLKLNNVYIVGNENTYETIDKLNIDGIKLLEETKGLYTLEWKWEESEDDTKLVREGLATYRIYIDIYSKYFGEV